jgi:hypothetical protein
MQPFKILPDAAADPAILTIPFDFCAMLLFEVNMTAAAPSQTGEAS